MDSSISNANAYSLYNSQCCTFYTDSNPVPINSSEWKHHMSQFVSTSEYCLCYSIQPWMCIFICMLMQSMNDWKCIEALYKYYSGRTLTCRITSHHSTHFQSIQLKATRHTRDVHRFVKHNHKFRGAKLPFVWIFLWQMPKSSFLCIMHSSISNFRLFYFFRLFCFFFRMFSFFSTLLLISNLLLFLSVLPFSKRFFVTLWGILLKAIFLRTVSFFCYLKNVFFLWRTKWKICGWL